MLTYGGPAEKIDNQPILSSFFGATNYLNEFITPHNLGVEQLYESLAAPTLKEKIYNCWAWVANKVKYVQSISGVLQIQGKISRQNDLWIAPNLIISTKVGNCFNKSALLTSLVRNALPDDKVSLVLGNITSDGIGGHAYVICQLDSEIYLLESTRPDIKNPFVIASDVQIYDPVIFVNERETAYIPNKKVKEPLGMCCLKFLADYLNSGLCTEWRE